MTNLYALGFRQYTKSAEPSPWTDSRYNEMIESSINHPPYVKLEKLSPSKVPSESPAKSTSEQVCMVQLGLRRVGCPEVINM